MTLPPRDVGAPKPFAHYDRRSYPTLAVGEGYALWAPTYDEVDDRLDLDLLEASSFLRERVPGSRVVDLGCGTGRTGAWLASRGAREVVGFEAREFDERFVTDEWALAVPGYAKYVGLPVAHAWVYERRASTR